MREDYSEVCGNCNYFNNISGWCNRRNRYMKSSGRCNRFDLGDWLKLRKEKNIELKEDFSVYKER